MARLRLVTRGDDAGSCLAANRAVEAAARAGTLRNASVIACGPWFDDAAERLREIDGLSVGLHLTLTSEWTAPVWGPLADAVPGLIDARGVFPPSVRDLKGQGATVDEVLREAAAQLARMRQAGLSPDYCDEHMGIAHVVADWRAPIDAWVRAEGMRVVHTVRGLPQGESISERFERATPGDYILVNHPGYDDEEMRAIGNADHPLGVVAREREGDRRFWLDPSLIEAARQHDVAFVRYSDIL